MGDLTEKKYSLREKVDVNYFFSHVNAKKMKLDRKYPISHEIY